MADHVVYFEQKEWTAVVDALQAYKELLTTKIENAITPKYKSLLIERLMIVNSLLR